MQSWRFRTLTGAGLLAAALWLGACASQPRVEAPPAPTAAPTAELPAATAVAPVDATAVALPAADSPPDWTVTASRDGDYYVLGNPAAPIRLVDYSDFL